MMNVRETDTRLETQGGESLLGTAILLWRRRWWLLLAAAMGALLATLLAFTMVPVYRSTLVMMPANSGNSGILGSLNGMIGSVGGGLAELVGLGASATGGSTADESLAVLRSRDFTDRFIATKGLASELYADKWDSRLNKWKVAQRRQPTAAQAFKYFDSKIRSISSERRTGIVTVSIEWKDPATAAFWANAMVDLLNEEMRTRAKRSADASVGYLQREIAQTSDIGTREAISRLIEAQVRQRMLANVTQEYAFRVVDRAVPADRDDPVRPKRLTLIIAGTLMGAMIAALTVVVVRRASGLER